MRMMLKIRLLFFAVLRDIAGRSEDALEVPAGTRAGDVWQRLRDEYPVLADYAQPPMIAINESYAAAGTLLCDGDELAFIPPVAGG
jgi:molybdopterin synthase catalytic subunit